MTEFVRGTAILLLAFQVLFSVGCGGTKPGPAPAPKAAAEKGPVVPVKAESPKEDLKAERELYAYDAKGRRDPFLSLAQAIKEKPKKKGAAAIETYDVSEIKVSAILWDNRQYFALMTLPDKKFLTAREGMVLGLYGGKIEKITKDAVLIREHIKDYKGQLKTKDTILRLRKEGEE